MFQPQKHWRVSGEPRGKLGGSHKSGQATTARASVYQNGGVEFLSQTLGPAQNAPPLSGMFLYRGVYIDVFVLAQTLPPNPPPAPPVSRVAVAVWGWFRFRAWFRV